VHICVQEHRFYYPDIKLKYHDIGKDWTFILASAWENFVNVNIGGVWHAMSSQGFE